LDDRDRKFLRLVRELRASNEPAYEALIVLMIRADHRK